MRDVLVDMTALNTPSRERGIGRYVKSLCRALAERAHWATVPGVPHEPLSIAGLTRHCGRLAGESNESPQTRATSGSSSARFNISDISWSGACSWVA